MTTIDQTESLKPSPRLVANRRDFFWVYFSSLGTMLALVLGAFVVQGSGMALSEIWYALPASAVIALIPPLIAHFLRTGRRAVQFLFGAILAPFVAALVVNALAMFRAIT